MLTVFSTSFSYCLLVPASDFLLYKPTDSDTYLSPVPFPCYIQISDGGILGWFAMCLRQNIVVDDSFAGKFDQIYVIYDPGCVTLVSINLQLTFPAVTLGIILMLF